MEQGLAEMLPPQPEQEGPAMLPPDIGRATLAALGDPAVLNVQTKESSLKNLPELCAMLGRKSLHFEAMDQFSATSRPVSEDAKPWDRRFMIWANNTTAANKELIATLMETDASTIPAPDTDAHFAQAFRNKFFSPTKEDGSSGTQRFLEMVAKGCDDPMMFMEKIQQMPKTFLNFFGDKPAQDMLLLFAQSYAIAWQAEIERVGITDKSIIKERGQQLAQSLQDSLAEEITNPASRDAFVHWTTSLGTAPQTRETANMVPIKENSPKVDYKEIEKKILKAKEDMLSEKKFLEINTKITEITNRFTNAKNGEYTFEQYKQDRAKVENKHGVIRTQSIEEFRAVLNQLDAEHADEIAEHEAKHAAEGIAQGLEIAFVITIARDEANKLIIHPSTELTFGEKVANMSVSGMQETIRKTLHAPGEKMSADDLSMVQAA